MGSAAAAQDPAGTHEPAPSPKPQPINKYVVRGCLNGSTLTDIEPMQPRLKLPEKLPESMNSYYWIALRVGNSLATTLIYVIQ